MARLIEQLTEAKIRKICTPGLYADGRGLYLQIRAGGRSWIFRFTLNGRTRDKGIGALADIGLIAARAKAADCRALLAKGIDPIEQAKAERTAGFVTVAGPSGPTFRETADKYMDEKLRRLRSEVHRKQWRYTLETFAYPIIGDMPVATVGTSDILTVLRPIWETRCETASRLRGRIERILARAAVEGLRTGSNPAQWRGHLKEALPERSEVSPIVHHPAMKFSDVPAFMSELAARTEVSAAVLQFLILTAARTGEVTGATWPEIDWHEQIWIVPADRMKAGRMHVVPLSTGALAALQTMQPLRDIGGGFVFPGRNSRGLSSMTLLALLQRRMNRHLTVHGFRSSFRDWCGDVNGAPREIAELALAHVVGDDTERSYRRGNAIEKRRELMQQWSDFCLQPPTSTAVVPLRAANRIPA